MIFDRIHLRFSCEQYDMEFPFKVHMNRKSGALVKFLSELITVAHQVKDGSIVINQAVRDDQFNPDTEFIPVSAGNNPELYRVLVHEQPVIHEVGRGKKCTTF